MKELGRETEKQYILDIYRNHKPEIHLYPGVIEMIKELKEKDYKVGIITDGRPKGQRNKIKALGLEELIDDIVITDELGGVQFRKPCDIAFRIIATHWKINPADIVYVGDNANKDFQAPQQLGMKSVWLKSEDGVYLQHDGSLSIRKICEITDFINLL